MLSRWDPLGPGDSLVFEIFVLACSLAQMVLMGATFESALVPVGWVGCGSYHVWIPLGPGDPLAFQIFVLQSIERILEKRLRLICANLVRFPHTPLTIPIAVHWLCRTENAHINLRRFSRILSIDCSMCFQYFLHAFFFIKNTQPSCFQFYLPVAAAPIAEEVH